ncbi:MAG: hypothetical protein AAB284_05095 [Chloroflexota bacterium]
MNRHLDPDEVAVDRLLAAVPRVPPPLGFRDAVMRRIARRHAPLYEWAFAAALAVPSLAFLGWEFALGGLDFAAAVQNVFVAATWTEDRAFFFVDGLVVLAAALLGAAGLVGTHAIVSEGAAAA